MQHKGMLMQVKEDIVKMKKPTRFREQAEMLEVLNKKIYMLFIPKEKECASELRNTKRFRWSQKTTNVDDRRIIFLVKINSFTTSK